jgi:hypothetical protein
MVRPKRCGFGVPDRSRCGLYSQEILGLRYLPFRIQHHQGNLL